MESEVLGSWPSLSGLRYRVSFVDWSKELCQRWVRNFVSRL